MKEAPTFRGFWKLAKCVVCRARECCLKSWRSNGRPIYWCSDSCHEMGEGITGKIPIVVIDKKR